MIKLKLDKLSERFEHFNFENDKLTAIGLGFSKNNIYINHSFADSMYKYKFYKKSEFWKALKDFLILRKIMEKNNGK